MASIQSLKKNLKNLTHDLFFDCYVTEIFCAPDKKQEILKVAQKIEAMHNQTLHQIYLFRKQNLRGKESKKFFNDLKRQIANLAQEIIEMLDKLESKA